VEDGPQKVHGVKIEAEMKTPSSTVALDVAFAEDMEHNGRSLQGVVDFHLKEEGSHVLAVTVSYTETGATSGRSRSFRKLYQFVALSCLVVRTKISSVGKNWALEAQLENSGEEVIVLESVGLEVKAWCKATGLNWDENPVLTPGDVQQVCFLVEPIAEREATMGMLSIGWRGAMGNQGILSTGWLGRKVA
jgi:hypothetical protein